MNSWVQMKQSMVFNTSRDTGSVQVNAYMSTDRAGHMHAVQCAALHITA